MFQLLYWLLILGVSFCWVKEFPSTKIFSLNCLAPSSVAKSKKLEAALKFKPGFPPELAKKVRELFRSEDSWLKFLSCRYSDIQEVEVTLERKERILCGPTVKLVFRMEGRSKTVFAKLPRLFPGDGRNPSALELRFTLEASQAGVTPPSTVIQDSLLIEHPQGAVSLYQVAHDPALFELFLAQEEIIIRKIGKAYGILNKRLRILHCDVKGDHIWIQFGKNGDPPQVYLIDFSTLDDDGDISQRIYREEEDLRDLIVCMTRFWLGRTKDLHQRGLDITSRSTTYITWAKEGYESVPANGLGFVEAMDGSL